MPEIALTPQMIETFSAHFGKSVAVLHSSLAIGARFDEWKRIRRGRQGLSSAPQRRLCAGAIAGAYHHRRGAGGHL